MDNPVLFFFTSYAELPEEIITVVSFWPKNDEKNAGIVYYIKNTCVSILMSTYFLCLEKLSAGMQIRIFGCTVTNA